MQKVQRGITGQCYQSNINENCTVKDLIKMCKDNKIGGYSKYKKKKDLINFVKKKLKRKLNPKMKQELIKQWKSRQGDIQKAIKELSQKEKLKQHALEWTNIVDKLQKEEKKRKKSYKNPEASMKVVSASPEMISISEEEKIQSLVERGIEQARRGSVRLTNAFNSQMNQLLDIYDMLGQYSARQLKKIAEKLIYIGIIGRDILQSGYIQRIIQIGAVLHAFHQLHKRKISYAQFNSRLLAIKYASKYM